MCPTRTWAIAAHRHRSENTALKLDVNGRIDVYLTVLVICVSVDFGDFRFDCPAEAIQKVCAAIISLSAPREFRILPPRPRRATFPTLCNVADDQFQFAKRAATDNLTRIIKIRRAWRIVTDREG